MRREIRADLLMVSLAHFNALKRGADHLGDIAISRQDRLTSAPAIDRFARRI